MKKNILWIMGATAVFAALILAGCGSSGGGGIAAPEAIIRVSVGSGGEGNDASTYSSINSDGRYVAFQSDATNLVNGDTNGQSDIFVRDRMTGVTTRVSVDSAGVQGNGSSESPSLSADGRYVAFQSSATNLVAGDTNNGYDIFVHDRQTGMTSRVSVATGGSQTTSFNSSVAPSISADGRSVAFVSSATNLVTGDTNGQTDVFIHDRQTGATTRVSVATDGTQGNSYVGGLPGISADGRYVAFDSNASNLVSGDTNNVFDVFIHDRQTSTTTRVSVDSAGIQGNGGSYAPALSAEGRYVTFSSDATNLVGGDTNGRPDVFVHDRQPGATTRVSVASNGSPSDGSSYNASISADGRYVAFESSAANLVSNDTNLSWDIFIHDLMTGATARVSVDRNGGASNSGSNNPLVCADGRYVAFYSDADNLVPGDTNGSTDVFRAPNALWAP